MQVTIDVPDSFLKEISFGFFEPGKEIKFMLAVKLVETGRISTGKASEWLGISKPRFLHEMGRYGLSPLPLEERALNEDISNVENGAS